MEKCWGATFLLLRNGELGETKFTEQIIHSSGSQLGQFCLPENICLFLETFLVVPACGGGDGECSTSIQWTEARDAANIRQYSGPLCTAESYLILNVNRAEIEKPSLIPTKELRTCHFAWTPTWLSSILIGRQDPASHVSRESRAARSHHLTSGRADSSCDK